jgi:hypothetical protein
MTGRSVSSSWRHSAEEDTAYRIVIASDECPRSSCNSFSMTPRLRDRDTGTSRRRPDFVIVQPNHAPAQVHVGPVETKKFAQA